LVDVYIALTEFNRQKFIEGGLPTERIMVKPNFLRSEIQAGDGRGGYAIYIGRLTPEKGVETLLTAWQSLTDRIPLKLVGDGPLAPQVRLAAQSNQNLDYTEFRPMRDVLELIRNADFLVMPSQWYEGLPRVIIEAFSVGTPVIGSRLGSIAELIDESRTGWLFRPGDPDLCLPW